MDLTSSSQILGIGIDLVENARIARSITEFGDRFLHRVFCEGEIAYCQTMRNSTPHYAARFAAKEAVSKAFGCGIGDQLGWLDIEVVRSQSGLPAVLLHGHGQELAGQRGVTRIFLSLSHTEHYAVANVLLSGNHEPA